MFIRQHLDQFRASPRLCASPQNLVFSLVPARRVWRAPRGELIQETTMPSVPTDNYLHFLICIFSKCHTQTSIHTQTSVCKSVCLCSLFGKGQSQMAVIVYPWEMPHKGETKTLGPLLLVVLIFDLQAAALRQNK